MRGQCLREFPVLRVLGTTVWLVSGLLLIAIATEPVGISAQFFLGLTAVIGMYAIKTMGLRGVWRHVFLGLGTTVVIRYLFWRTSSTLPPVGDLWNFIPGIILWASECFSMLMLAISLFVIADPLERKPARRAPDDQLPTVDVFVPTYNEDADMLALTLAAAKLMDYPAEKLTVYLLDDGGSDQKCQQDNKEKAKEAQQRRATLTQLANELGCIYLTRARNTHAKAGNMNSALPRSRGQLIAIFDADHAPMRQFLRETVGYYLDDPKLFLVQTPHFFTNPDPIEKNLATFGHMPSENEMFYGTIQKGLDKWNAAFFCGSAALISRAAIESVGGFSGLSITEDCETALDLHSKGWNSLYIDKPMISGLQPETMLSFIGQRSRWCQGMIQILILKNPLLKKGLKLSQKIAYISSSMFWMFPVARLPFFISPLLYIFFSMQIYVANSQEFIAYTILYMTANLLMQNYLYGTVRWPWISELYEYSQSFLLAKGVFSVIMKPRAPTFNVTAKGQTLDNDHLSGLFRPFFIAYCVMALAELIVAYRLILEPGSKDLLVVVGIWNTFNLLLASVSLGVVAERRERRRTPRLDIEREAELMIGPVVIPVKTVNISAGGVRLRAEEGRVPRHLQPGAPAVLRIKLRTPDQRVEMLSLTLRNRGADAMGPLFGFEYAGLRPHHYLVIADMMYCDMAVLEKFRAGRRKQKNIFAGIFAMVGYGFSEPARAFTYYMNDRRAQRAARAELEQKALANAALAMPVAEPEPMIVEAPASLPVPAPAAESVSPQVAAMAELVTAVERLTPAEALARVHELMASINKKDAERALPAAAEAP